MTTYSLDELRALPVENIAGLLSADAPSAGRAFLDSLSPEEKKRLTARLKEQAAPLVDYLQAVGRDWEKETGQSIPGTIEEWQRLATRAGIPPEKLFDGKWSPAEVGPYILGYFDRLRDAATPPTNDNINISLPASPDLMRLAKKIKEELPKGGKKIDIARDFTGGDEKRAESLLRQLRRYPKLLS